MSDARSGIALSDMFAYTVQLALEGMDSDRRHDSVWLNEVGMILDRMAYRLCAEHGIYAVAEEFRLDMAEQREMTRRDIIRLQTEIAVLKERQEIYARQQVEIQKRDEALKDRLEKLAADIEAFYAKHGYQKQGDTWVKVHRPADPLALLQLLFPKRG